MAIVRANATAITLDPTELELGQLANGGLTGGGAVLSRPTVGSATPLNLQLEYGINGGAGGKYAWNFAGIGLTYSPALPTKGFPAPDITGGTLVRLFDQINKTPGSIDISGFAVPAATFWSQVEANDNLVVLTSILAGNDTIIGSRVQIRSATLINGLGGRDAIASERLGRQVKVARNELHTPHPSRTIPNGHP